jgi:hypothetical protein
MTDEEWAKKNITIHFTPEKHGGVTVRASFIMYTEVEISELLECNDMECVKRHAVQKCIQTLLSALFQNRRREFADALTKFIKDCHKNPYGWSYEAESELLKCAERMAPEITLKGIGNT